MHGHAERADTLPCDPDPNAETVADSAPASEHRHHCDTCSGRDSSDAYSWSSFTHACACQTATGKPT